MKRAEVWWVEFDPAVGSEIKKIRPAVILSNDLANRHLSRVVVVPPQALKLRIAVASRSFHGAQRCPLGRM